MSGAEQRELIEQLRKTLGLLGVQSAEELLLRDQSRVSVPKPTAKLEEYSERFIDFTYENPTTYHVVEYFKRQLEELGFQYLDERKLGWYETIAKSTGRNGKFYTIRNGTNLAAFVVGKDWKFTNGIGAVACHVDALTCKLKPASIKEKVQDFALLGVAPYGGTLNELWLDRDLGIGGRVLYTDDDGKIKTRLVNSTPHPVARIPSLAPHFGQPAEGPFDKEDQMVPVLACRPVDPNDTISDDEKKSPLYGKHLMHVLRYVAKMANVKVSQLTQLDLELFDTQKGAIGGLHEDFLFAPRLDDRLCSFSAMTSLLEFARNLKDNDNCDTFNMVALFDNEEIGSLSRQGAKGGLLETVVRRCIKCDTIQDTLGALFANSIILSADVTHMFNPNFKQVYMAEHQPMANVGITLSLDSNGHMATDVVGTAFIEKLARDHGDKIQYFQIKNNSRSGGTIGPSLAAQTGARTIDLGIPQLSMHSIRATTGAKDIGLAVRFFTHFFQHWRQTYDSFN